mmetsp:Transcript_110835/g.264397  ORF Transcript_110835/g.264397 Transcript_110835/m.264397 type:complete len:217 (-) Transcript_110835:72-722(-)
MFGAVELLLQICCLLKVLFEQLLYSSLVLLFDMPLLPIELLLAPLHGCLVACDRSLELLLQLLQAESRSEQLVLELPCLLARSLQLHALRVQSFVEPLELTRVPLRCSYRFVLQVFYTPGHFSTDLLYCSFVSCGGIPHFSRVRCLQRVDFTGVLRTHVIDSLLMRGPKLLLELLQCSSLLLENILKLCLKLVFQLHLSSLQCTPSILLRALKLAL